ASSASTGSGVWSASANTGGSTFEVSGSYTCDSESWYDYTDYEEVYDTTGPVVPYDFFFTSNWANSFGSVGTWGIWTASTPSGVSVYINGGSSSNSCGGSVPGYCPITIANEPYYLQFADSPDTTTAEATLSTQTFFWNVSVSELSGDAPINLAGYSVPNGWTLKFLTNQGNPPFTSELYFSFPSGTSAQTYSLGLVGSDGSGSSSRIALRIDVLPMLTVSPSASPRSGG